MDYAQMKEEKKARLEEYNKTYEKQLRLMGFIQSLETDIGHIRAANVQTSREKRRQRKLIKINEKDIQRYKADLAAMPPVPEFK